MDHYPKTNRRQRRHPVWSPRPQGRREFSLIALARHGIGPGMTVDRISLTADKRIQ